MKFRSSPLILLLLLFSAAVPGSFKGSPSKPDQAAFPADKRVVFQTDKRVETLYFVFLLCDYPVMTPYPSAYKEAAKTWFTPHRDHAAVKLGTALIQKGFYTDYAMNWLFLHSHMPVLKRNRRVDFPFEQRAIDPDSLALFRKALADFYVDAGCEAFLRSQQSLLDKMILSTYDSLTRKDIIQVIERYYGIRKKGTFTVILSPLLHSGGFAIQRTDKNEQYVVIGPGGQKDSLPYFDKVFLEQDMVIHEFSHNYANPIVDRFMTESKKLEADLFPPVKDLVEEEGYSSWEGFMYELIVRSTTIRLVEQVYGPEAAAELMEYEKSVGFEYVEIVVEELKQYEVDRAKYPSLVEFYPNILKRLGAIER